ncbi:MAG TPA: hypothetical protein VIH28_10165 [Ignavibacteriaceae bacterium]
MSINIANWNGKGISLRGEKVVKVCDICLYPDDLIETTDGYFCHEYCYKKMYGEKPKVIVHWQPEEE